MSRWLSTGGTSASLDHTHLEPETPAPVFALRAFKATIFGSPDENDETQLPKPKGPFFETEKPIKPDQELKRIRTPLVSPTKSILVTPGTKRTERKAVAFRDAPLRKELLKKLETNKDAVFNEQVMEERSKEPLETTGSSTSLTRKLQRSRSRSPLKEVHTQLSPSPKQRVPRITSESRPLPPRLNFKQDESREAPPKQSTTKPSSKPSSEIPTSRVPANGTPSTYRARTDRQLKKLVQRYEIVKAYARMKDQEVIDLGLQIKKLEEENKKLAASLEANGIPTTHNRDSHGAHNHQKEEKPYRSTKPTTRDPSATLKKRSSSSSAATAATIPEPDIWLEVIPPVPESRAARNKLFPCTKPTTASARVPNLAPDRLAAARARLQVKAEERRKALEAAAATGS